MSTVVTSEVAVVAAALRSGQVVAVPTDTVYGLGVSLEHGRVADLVAAKQRPDGRPIAVLVASPEDAAAIGVFGVDAATIAEQFWPGPVTIVVARTAGFVTDLGGEPTTVGLRCPADPALLGLLAATGPLAVTSANRSGEPELLDAPAIHAAFDGVVPVVWDDGPRAGVPSTVVNCAADPPQLLRVGSIGRHALASLGVTLA